MASSAKVILLAALSAALVGTAGCKEERDRYPEPKPGPITGVATGGAAGVGGGGGGQGGAGGAEVPNFCECMASAITRDPCKDCVNVAGNDECLSQYQQCQLDGPCLGHLNCPGSKCSDLAEPERSACVQSCIVDAPDDASLHLYANLLACVCGACAAKCAAIEPLSCE